MAGVRPLLSLLAVLLLAGGILLQLLVILSGGTNGNPESKIYFLQASTDGITNGKPNIPNPARWTFFAICGVNNGLNANCWKTRAGLPFSVGENFGTTMGVPASLVGNKSLHDVSVAMFALYLAALFFAVVAFLLSVFACFARLGAYMTGAMTAVALLLQTCAAALMTAWTVEGRNAFRSNNQSANLGVYAYAFTWSAMACYLIATVLFCVGGSAGKTESYQKSSYFGRKRSTKSRGSFIDSENGRRVKDDYD